MLSAEHKLMPGEDMLEHEGSQYQEFEDGKDVIAILRERLEDHRKNPDAVISLEQLKERLRAEGIL